MMGGRILHFALKKECSVHSVSTCMDSENARYLVKGFFEKNKTEHAVQSYAAGNEVFSLLNQR